MDRYLIYEFTILAVAQAMLNQINLMGEAHWSGLGYHRDEQGIIGKNGGVDDLNAPRTKTWAIIQESPDGTFYFTSLSNDERFKNATTMLEQAGFIFVEKEIPEDWLPKDGENE